MTSLNKDVEEQVASPMQSFIKYIKKHGPIADNSASVTETQRNLSESFFQFKNATYDLYNEKICEVFVQNKPQVIFILGQAGDGKTYLVRQVLQTLGYSNAEWANIMAQDGFATVQAHSSMQKRAYTPFRQIKHPQQATDILKATQEQEDLLPWFIVTDLSEANKNDDSVMKLMKNIQDIVCAQYRNEESEDANKIIIVTANNGLILEHLENFSLLLEAKANTNFDFSTAKNLQNFIGDQRAINKWLSFINDCDELDVKCFTELTHSLRKHIIAQNLGIDSLQNFGIKCFSMEHILDANMAQQIFLDVLLDERWERCANDNCQCRTCCPILQNRQELLNPHVLLALHHIFQLLIYNKLHFTVRNILCVLSNALLGYLYVGEDAKELSIHNMNEVSLLDCSIVQKLYEDQGQLDTAVDYVQAKYLLDNMQHNHEAEQEIIGTKASSCLYSNPIENIFAYNCRDELFKQKEHTVYGVFAQLRKLKLGFSTNYVYERLMQVLIENGIKQALNENDRGQEQSNTAQIDADYKVLEPIFNKLTQENKLFTPLCKEFSPLKKYEESLQEVRKNKQQKEVDKLYQELLPHIVQIQAVFKRLVFFYCMPLYKETVFLHDFTNKIASFNEQNCIEAEPQESLLKLKSYSNLNQSLAIPFHLFEFTCFRHAESYLSLIKAEDELDDSTLNIINYGLKHGLSQSLTTQGEYGKIPISINNSINSIDMILILNEQFRVDFLKSSAVNSSDGNSRENYLVVLNTFNNSAQRIPILRFWPSSSAQNKNPIDYELSTQNFEFLACLSQGMLSSVFSTECNTALQVFKSKVFANIEQTNNSKIKSNNQKALNNISFVGLERGK